MNTRYVCPECGRKRVFARYIDTESGKYLAPNVGRCNREVKCGYHYTPKKYFNANKHLIFSSQVQPRFKRLQRPFPQSNPVSYIPIEAFRQSLKRHSQNNFVKYLVSLFGSKLTGRLIDNYFIGTSRHWPNATVFWQIDSFGQVRTGKIMLYCPNTGKRIREPFSHISWAHTLLKLKGFNLKQCFFGEHLLKTEINKPIAIVESEKTAIIASVYLPQFIWLAAGSISNLNTEKFKILTGRKVFLFPDVNGYEKWRKKALEIEAIVFCEIFVSDILETNATILDKEKSLDIADYLIKQNDKFN